MKRLTYILKEQLLRLNQLSNIVSFDCIAYPLKFHLVNAYILV
jgi:hypothetical protein